MSSHFLENCGSGFLAAYRSSPQDIIDSLNSDNKLNKENSSNGIQLSERKRSTRSTKPRGFWVLLLLWFSFFFFLSYEYRFFLNFYFYSHLSGTNFFLNSFFSIYFNPYRTSISRNRWRIKESFWIQ